MTAGILDPSAAVSGAQLTSTEEELAARIDAQGSNARSVAQVATVLGAAFLLYRAYMKRRLTEEMRNQDPSNLAIIASAVYKGFLPRWVQMLAPALVSAYLQGTREVSSGSIPEEYMLDIAQGYAEHLGEHINEVSMESLVQGYQAQLNRRVVARRAVENVIGAYGVPLRTMNSLVTVWTGEQKKVLSRTKPTTKYDAKAAALIEKAARNRGKAIGETEAWTAKSQAKQLVWMWGIQHGTIPETATRVWRTAHDERVCPACGPMDKTEVPVGKPFTTDAGEFWSPPLHPNCRCDIDLAINILDEFRPIREEELVGKSLVDQPRDENGRWTTGFQASKEDIRRYSDEDCGMLARELHNRTGWPIVGLVDDDGEGWIHALVERPDGKLVDITGVHTYDEVASQWDNMGDWEFGYLHKDWDDTLKEHDKHTGEVADQILGEVKKARGDDPFDRDRRGRFAHREARTAEPKIRLTPVTLPGIQIPDITEPAEPEGKVSLGWAKVPLRSGSVAPVSLGQGKVSLGGDQEEQVGFERRGFTRRAFSRFNLPTPEQFRVSLGKPKGEPPAGYHLLPTPLWGFVGTKEENTGAVMADVDEEAPFYSPEDIEDALRDYWNEEMQFEYETHANGEMDEAAYIITDAQGQRYVIDTDTYIDVMDWVINGKPADGRTRAELEGLKAYAEDDYPEPDPERKTWVGYETLADHLGMSGLVEWRTPTLMLTMYGTDLTDMNPGVKRAMQNPGRWAITEARPDSVWAKDFESPVHIVYAEPPEEQHRYGNPSYTG